MVGSDVQEGQVRLNVLRSQFAPNLPPLEEDGQFGPLTAEMWRVFQTWAGLVPDASVGPLTVAALVAAEALLAPTPEPVPEPNVPVEPKPEEKPWWIPPLATGTTYIGAFKKMMTKTIEITVPTFEGLAKGFVAWVHDLYISNVRTFAPYLAAVLLMWVTPALGWLGIQPDEGALIAAGAGFLGWLWYAVARTFERQQKWPLLAKIGGYMLIIPKTPTYEAPTSR
ncbi:MAG: peptidoglycan-binding protein [Sphaerochaeta sp.]|jgi:hypothetical protein|nr:peptidoglycan-binding protein [Sphaerochaeta sp.]